MCTNMKTNQGLFFSLSLLKMTEIGFGSYISHFENFLGKNQDRTKGTNFTSCPRHQTPMLRPWRSYILWSLLSFGSYYTGIFTTLFPQSPLTLTVSEFNTACSNQDITNIKFQGQSHWLTLFDSTWRYLRLSLWNMYRPPVEAPRAMYRRHTPMDVYCVQKLIVKNNMKTWGVKNGLTHEYPHLIIYQSLPHLTCTYGHGLELVPFCVAKPF